MSLPCVADLFAQNHDAGTVSTSVGSNKDFYSIDHLKAVIRGFIQHGIPLVASNRNGGHFNTVIGYWDHPDGFYVYCADSLDGYGNSFTVQPMRWRKMIITPEILPVRYFSGWFGNLLLYGHGGSCGTGGWAAAIDGAFPPNTLCGYLN